MAEWPGLINTTIRQYLREVERNIMRNRKLFGMLKAKGRFKFNQGGGDKVEWRVQYKRHTMQGHADSDTLSFPRNDLFKRASLDWRGYASTDSMTKKEGLMNKGKEAIINRYAEIGKQLVDDMQESFGDEFYVDGNATGNEKRIHGIESFFGTTGSAIVGTTVMNPDDTYADLDTDLGSYGGSWSTSTWPKNGTGPSEYDFWSPLVVDYTSSLAAGSGGWTSATATWAARCREVMRFALIHSKKNKSEDGMIGSVMIDAEMYRQFCDEVAENERIVIDRGVKRDGLISMGFTDVINFDGAEITYEYGQPSATGYGWNIAQMEVRSLQDQMFVVEGPDWDIQTQSWRTSVDFFGNLCFNPRYFFKLGAFGSSGA
ncbi:MAG: phage major capsid protein [Candidatus Competibacteraceae bacterium]|nr:phage major capsid protein [Candidatus Competibacteraceae bacterium]